MSAYMVANENLSKMAGYIAAILDGTEHMGTCMGAKAIYPSRDIIETFKAIPMAYNPDFQEYDAAVIHKALFDMNRQSLVERYGECTDEYEEYDGSAVETREDTRDEWQCRLFMLVRNYIYQCDEGKVPETALFKAMKGIEQTLAELIASETASRDWGCGWGEWKPVKEGERKSKMRR